MIKMSRKAKKAMAVALTAGMLASTAVTPVMAATQGWKQNSKGWWYQNADGSYPANKWSQINGKWYYFDANGYMLENTWVKDSKGDWYYVGANGAMLVNSWAKDKAGLWYWLTDDGSMFEGGWAKINGEWYFFNADGVMQSGVIKVEGETYYLGGNDQGWMQTGKVNVAGTEYNFGTDGACTDAAAPAAAKVFDKKGNEIAPEVDVEAVDGITGTITNALADYKAEYGNVLIAGSDAYFKVLVSDKEGKPVVNTPVSLKMDYNPVTHNDVSSNNFASPKNGWVQMTDANGYAIFVIGDYNGNVAPTDNIFALYTLTATAVSTSQEYKTDLAFATVDLGRVNVVNNDKTDDEWLSVASQNSKSADSDIVSVTTTIDGAESVEYVKTQQVNEKNTTTHKVAIELNPQIVIPYANSTSVVDNYYKEVKKEIKEYTVYQNGGNTSFKVTDIPAGLKYATLNFASIDVSEHTRVEIYAYKAGTTELVTADKKPYIIDGPLTQTNFGYQIPVQKNQALDVEVKVISEGQVNDDQNAGLVVTDVTGLYDTKTTDTTKAIPLSDSVKWSAVENQYSNAKTMTQAEAEKYIVGYDAKYTATGNTYTYQVPVFPYTGNAILTVKDVNKKVVGYFTIPTENIVKNGVHQNENDIVKRYESGALTVAVANRAILVSYDEAFNNVGSIVQNGNQVVVNSEATGITALQAKINLAGFEDEINLINNTVYTSVHWSPIPNKEAAIESQDFYALVGQNITVKAQLVDNNGNKVAQSGQQITYAYDTDNKAITALGAVGTTKATATAYTATTDANGQATLKLASGDEQALVSLLHATSSSYNVQLMIGDVVVNNANLRWVEAGLSFTSDVDTASTDYDKVDTLKGTTIVAELKSPLKKDVGSNWILGYEVVGDTQDDKNGSGAVTKSREVETITGLTVGVTKSGDGEIVTTGMENGSAKVTSTKAGVSTLTGTIDAKSVVSGKEVVFTVVTRNAEGKEIDRKNYVNVGEGTPSIGASLNLPINWGTVGTTISLVTPKGENLIVKSDETVYVKVQDTFGNPIASNEVEVTVTYSDGVNTFNANATGAKAVTEGASKNTKVEITEAEKGLEKVKLLASAPILNAEGTQTGTFKPKTATITAKIGNETTQQTIQYLDEVTNTVAFDMVTATYDYKTGSNPKVTLYFTNPVNVNTLKKELFTVTTKVNGKPYNIPVSDVAIAADNNKVIVTIADQYKNGLDNLTDYTVAIASDKEIEGIKYNLCDTYGQTIAVKEFVFNTGMIDETAANDEVTEYIKEAPAKQAAQTALTSAVPTASVEYGANKDVVFTAVDGCTYVVTVNNNDIFAANTNDTTKLTTLADISGVNTKTSVVTVVYTNTTYSDIKRTVVYDVTASDSAIEFVAR